MFVYVCMCLFVRALGQYFDCGFDATDLTPSCDGYTIRSNFFLPLFSLFLAAGSSCIMVYGLVHSVLILRGRKPSMPSVSPLLELVSSLQIRISLRDCALGMLLNVSDCAPLERPSLRTA